MALTLCDFFLLSDLNPIKTSLTLDPAPPPPPPLRTSPCYNDSCVHPCLDQMQALYKRMTETPRPEKRPRNLP